MTPPRFQLGVGYPLCCLAKRVDSGPATTHIMPRDLPGQFAVFPLSGALLLPGGKLPLNIFEPRYLAMVEDALSSGRMFGLIQPNISLGQVENGPALYRVGCLGRLSSFSETEDGRFLITLSGLARFLVVEELALRRGYRCVHGDFSAFPEDFVDAPTLHLDRDQLFSALRGYFARRGFEANWDAIRQMPDATLLTTLCMACPFEDVEKQALLEAATVTERATTLHALLLMDQHGEDSAPASGRRDS
jgi:Lon protease-like protein